jgi:hypothetical protein
MKVINKRTLKAVKGNDCYVSFYSSGSQVVDLYKKDNNGIYQKRQYILRDRNKLSIKLLSSGYSECLFPSTKEASSFLRSILSSMPRKKSREIRELNKLTMANKI